MLRNLLLLCLAIITVGCNSADTFYVEACPPFSRRFNQEAPLQRDVLLVSQGGRQGVYVSPNGSELLSAQYLSEPLGSSETGFVLTAGQTVRLLHTRLTVHKIPLKDWTILYLQTDFLFEDKGVERLARFNHASTRMHLAMGNYFTGMGDSVEALIRPAPWEPQETPAERQVDWKRLLREGTPARD